MIKKVTSEEIESVILENENLRVVILPEIGGKMIELKNKITGTQFLLEPQNETRKYKKAFYGANFEDYDTSGFDECFPTIAQSNFATLSTNTITDIAFPDHGELWSQSWSSKMYNSILEIRASGISHNYNFVKRISLEDNTVTISYLLENISCEPFSYLWSAHPLLNVNTSSKIFLPSEVSSVLVNWSSDESVAKYGEELKWPFLNKNNRDINFSDVQNHELGFALKCFTEKLDKALAFVYHEDKDESISFNYLSDDDAYLGIWLCYGGWPLNGRKKHYTIGIEPTNGRADSLEEAVKRRKCSEIKAYTTKEWSLEITLDKGKPEFI